MDDLNLLEHTILNCIAAVIITLFLHAWIAAVLFLVAAALLYGIGWIIDRVKKATPPAREE